MPGSLPTAFVGCIANTLGISGVNPSIIYWAPCYFGWGIAPLAASTNAGASWSPATGLGVAGIHKIVGDPLSATGAYALSYISRSLRGENRRRWPESSVLDLSRRLREWIWYRNERNRRRFRHGITNSEAFPTTSSALQGNNPSGENLATEVFVTRISDATASCSFSVSPQSYLCRLGSVSVTIFGCRTQRVPMGRFKQPELGGILNGAAGSGTGIVYVLLNVNTTDTTRTATLTIGGQSLTLNQLPTSCSSESFTPGSVTVPGRRRTLVL